MTLEKQRYVWDFGAPDDVTTLGITLADNVLFTFLNELENDRDLIRLYFYPLFLSSKIAGLC